MFSFCMVPTDERKICIFPHFLFFLLFIFRFHFFLDQRVFWRFHFVKTWIPRLLHPSCLHSHCNKTLIYYFLLVKMMNHCSQKFCILSENPIVANKIVLMLNKGFERNTNKKKNNFHALYHKLIIIHFNS